MRPGDCEAIDSGAFVSICNHSVYIEVDDRDPMTRRTFAARASRKPILPQSGSLEPPAKYTARGSVHLERLQFQRIFSGQTSKENQYVDDIGERATA